VRVLLDENLPHDLIAELIGHDVVTVQGLGWAGVKNGDLLRRAAGQIDAFVTIEPAGRVAFQRWCRSCTMYSPFSP
jgi:hypothetical protein